MPSYHRGWRRCSGRETPLRHVLIFTAGLALGASLGVLAATRLYEVHRFGLHQECLLRVNRLTGNSNY
jgi:hypothetical protein